MALYIFDRPYCDNGIPYALMDEKAKILLLHDALYLNPERLGDREVYVFTREVEERGLQAHLSEKFRRISYDEFIDLVIENKVINFS
jgi:sulfur transfer complex TusBCD TusB component (DsrH family)